jgi:signal transduction histidine kinase/ligand-binding sensor domain-containing protein/DNA-binding response OmpR family regulator
MLLLVQFICLLSFGQPSGAQFEKLTEANGLSSNQVTCIFKDSRGFMWFGTRNGLNRYDGYDFKVWKHIPGDSLGLADNSIWHIDEDEKGNLWVGTQNGLCKYVFSENTFTNYTIQPSKQNNKTTFKVNDFCFSNDGRIWIAVSSGLFVLDNSSGSSTLVEAVLGADLDFSPVCLQYGEEKNVLWMGTFENGFYEYNLSTETASKIPVRNNENVSAKVIENIADSVLLFGTQNGGVYEYHIASQKLLKSAFINPNNNHKEIYDIESGSDENIWISWGHTLNMYKNKALHRQFKHDLQDNNSRSEGIINDLYHEQGLLWLAIGGSGMNVLNTKGKVFEPYFHKQTENPGNKDYVKTAVFDDHDNIWTGTFGNGIRVYNEKLKLIRTINDQNSILPDNSVSCIKIFDDKFWIGTIDGLLVYSDKEQKANKVYVHNDGLWHNTIVDIQKGQGNKVWIATQEGLNVLLLDNDSILKLDESSGLSNYKVTSLFKDRHNKIWISTYNGLSVYDPIKESFTNYYKSNSGKGLSDNRVHCVTSDADGNILIGTQNGLNVFIPDSNKFYWYFENDGLISNIINNIQLDKDGNVWLQTPSGISKIKDNYQKIETYDHRDGLSVNTQSMEISRKGKLLVAGKYWGFYLFHPDSIGNETETIPVHILEVGSLTGGPKKGFKKVKNEFNYNERNIKIEFTAPNYKTPQKISFAYKMEGLDEGWNYTGYRQREVEYKNLQPGSYTFKVMASDSNDFLKAQTDSCEIIVKPPWWRTWWMYIIYIVFSLFIIVISYYVRKRRFELIEGIRIAKENARLNKEKAELQKLNDEQKLRFFTNLSHEFRTPLTLISISLESVLTGKVLPEQMPKLKQLDQNSQRLNKLISQLLDYRKLTLNKKIVNWQNIEIIAFIKSIFQVFVPYAEKEGVDYQFFSPIKNVVISTDKDMLDKVIYNLISNACKNTPKNGKVRIDVRQVENKESNCDTETRKKNEQGDQKILQIMVSNTGKGIPEEYLDKIFDRFFQIPDINYQVSVGTGIGLSMVKEYVDLLRGAIKVESKPNQETTFCLSLPFTVLPEFNLKDQVYTKTSYTEEEVEENLNEEPIEDYHDKSPSAQSSKKVMLIVEDNHDLREALCKMFVPHFITLEAKNGKEGIEKAVKEVPDIIVSDVMMPEMDGFEMCEKCKKDELTSHIPIILLTARADVESKLTGLDIGADSYINKPFNSKELKVQVDNLLSNRERLRKKFEGKVYFSAPTTRQTDAAFIQKINKAIEENIDDSEFGVADLASHLSISTRQIQRKFSGLMDQTPKEYIRTYRLNKAANVLAGNYDMNISEIAYAFGFKYPKYFTEAFKKQFGMAPSEFGKKEE